MAQTFVQCMSKNIFKNMCGLIKKYLTKGQEKQTT